MPLRLLPYLLRLAFGYSAEAKADLVRKQMEARMFGQQYQQWVADALSEGKPLPLQPYSNLYVEEFWHGEIIKVPALTNREIYEWKLSGFLRMPWYLGYLAAVWSEAEKHNALEILRERLYKACLRDGIVGEHDAPLLWALFTGRYYGADKEHYDDPRGFIAAMASIELPQYLMAGGVQAVEHAVWAIMKGIHYTNTRGTTDATADV